MIAIQHEGAIKKFTTLPKIWTDENGTHLNITDGAAYGFYPVVTPSYNSATQQLGDIYFDSDDEVFTYPINTTAISETLQELKNSKIKSIKEQYRVQLAETDWIVIRDQELGQATDQEILDERSKLRTDCATHESNVNAATSKISVIDYTI